MNLVVGLGNIGSKYQNNRHNVGFMFLDSIKDIENEFQEDRSKHALLSKTHLGNTILIKPTTLMNTSGDAVRAVTNFYKINKNNLYVVHDDLDIKIGEYKIQKGVGPKIHNGILSIEEKLGGSDFWRVRIGVDNRDPLNREIGEKYVLSDFTSDELSVLTSVFEKIKVELSKLNIL